jgi:hypothetical protein
MVTTDTHFFTEREIELLLHALIRGGEPFSEADVVRALHWATEIRIGYAMLGLALQGRKALLVRGEDVLLADNKK